MANQDWKQKVRKFGERAAEVTRRTTKESIARAQKEVELRRLHGHIREKEFERHKALIRIGETVYGRHQAKTLRDTELRKLCAGVVVAEQSIAKFRKQIEKVRARPLVPKEK